MKTQHFHAKLLCQKPMLRQIECEVQNGPITMNGVLPVTTLYFFQKFVSVYQPPKRPYPDFEIVGNSFFPVSILNVSILNVSILNVSILNVSILNVSILNDTLNLFEIPFLVR